MQNILEVRDLGRSYVNFRLEHISFSIAGGTIMGLVGENGAGKSTTLNMITGCLSPSAGTVKINGTDMYEEPEKAKKE